MPDITISQPTIGLQARFSFKDPAARYIKSRLNTADNTIALTVSGVADMQELIDVDMRNPYQDAYVPMGVDEYLYQQDLRNKVPLITFKHEGLNGKLTHIRVPMNYIQEYGNIADINYINKVILIDLGIVPELLDTSVIFTDLNDFVLTRLGVNTEIKEVAIGNKEVISQADHDTREVVRGNLVTVRKTLLTKLNEVQLKYDNLLARLSQLNISLG